MAITDKVIELSPVNKKKNIIFYIIMGVLLATTVLFLVLYLIKPNAPGGAVTGINVTNNLFVRDDGKLLAVKGESYTLCAEVGYTGDADTYVDFDSQTNDIQIKLPDSVTESDIKGAVYNAAGDGEVAPEHERRLVYCKFTVSKTAQNTESATVIVRVGIKDAEGKKQETQKFAVPVTFAVSDIGVKDVAVKRVSYDKNPTSSFDVKKTGEDSFNVEVPFVRFSVEGGVGSPFATYRAYLDCIPFTDKFGQIANISTANNANKIEVKGSDDSVAEFGGVYNDKDGYYFEFQVKKTGTAVMTVTCNKNNSSPEKSIELTVRSVTADSATTVTDMFVTGEEIGSVAPDKDDAVNSVEMFAGTDNKFKFDLTRHIAVSPFKLQSAFWSSNPDIEITAEDSTEDKTVLQRSSMAGTGNVALQANKPGKATVTVRDRGGFGISVKFKVNVTYQAMSFGMRDGNNTKPAHREFAVKGGDGRITVTYILDVAGVTKVESSEFNANLVLDSSYDKNCGVTFKGMEKGVIPLTAVMTKETSATRYIYMEATLLYETASDIGDALVPVKFRTQAQTRDDEVFTVTFEPKAVAEDMEFIDSTRFDALIERENNALMSKYAKFVTSGNTATLTLNMNDAENASRYTSFTVGDLVRCYYYDDGHNKLDAALDDRVKAEISVSNASVSFSNAANILNSQILPVRGEGTGGTAQLHIRFTGGTSLVLSIKVVDNAEKMSIVGSDTSTQYYGYIGTDLPTLDLPEVKQIHASGLTRDAGDYSVAIYLNNRNFWLRASDPVASFGGYVYYLLDKDYTDSLTETEIREKAVFAVDGNGTSRSKSVYLMKDLYKLAYDNETSKVTAVGIVFYPGGEKVLGEDIDRASAAEYKITPVRKVDGIIVNDSTLSQDEHGNYAGGATSASTVQLSLTARFKTGMSGSDPIFGITTAYSAASGLVDGGYGYIDNLEIKTEGDIKHADGVLSFKMPTVETGKHADVKIIFSPVNAPDVTTAVAYRVQNLTLGLQKIELFKTKNADGSLSDPFAENEVILLSAERTPSNGRINEITVYYKLTYPTGDSSSYVMYDGVNYVTTTAGLVCTYADENSSAVENSWTPGGVPNSTRVHTGEVRIRADGGSAGNTEFALRSMMSESVISYALNVKVYAHNGAALLVTEDGDEFTSSSGANEITLDMRSANNKPSASLTLSPVFASENYYAGVAGGTVFAVTASGYDSNALACEWKADTNKLEIRSKGIALAGGSLTVTVTESAGSLTVGTYTFDITVNVDVYVWSVGIVAGGADVNAIEAHTDGSDAEERIALSAKFNGGVTGVDSPVGKENIAFVVMKDNVQVSAGMSSAFKTVKDGDSWYLVYNKKTTTLGSSKYFLKAVCGDVSSTAVPLTLVTTKRDVRFDVPADRNIFDLTATADVSAKVYIGGTNEVDPDAKPTYKVVKTDGTDYETGKAPATVSESGKLTVTVSSGDFKVVASYGSEKTELTVHVNNKVVSIQTHFEDQKESGGIVTLERIYNGKAGDCDIPLENMITLHGVDYRPPYTSEYDIVTSGDVLRYDRTNNKLVLTGAGSQTLTVRAKSTPNANWDITKTVVVIATTPKLSAAIENKESVSVNLMDDNAATEFSVTISSAGYTASDMTVTGEGITSGKFSYSNGILTLNKTAFASDDLTSIAAYTFTVGGKIGGLAAANTASVSVTVSATLAAPETPMFTVKNGGVSLNSGAPLSFTDSGKYTVETTDDRVTLAVTGAGATLDAGKLKFTTVGDIVITATLSAYGNNFPAGQMTLHVKNGVNSIAETLSLVGEGGALTEITTLEQIAADYSSNADKLVLDYAVDWSATGESFNIADITTYFVGPVTVVGNPTVSGNTAHWRLRVDGAGDVSLWVSAFKDGRQYVSSGKRAKFKTDGAFGDFAVNAVTTLKPGEGGSFVYTLEKTDDFKCDRETVVYSILSGADLLSVTGDAYTAKLTENGGVARVRAVLNIAGGALDGATAEYTFDITVVGVKKTTLAPQSTDKVYLNGADGVKEYNVEDLFSLVRDENIGNETYTVTSRIKSGSSYASIASNNLTAQNTTDGGMVEVEITVTFSGGVWSANNPSLVFTRTVYVLPSVSFASRYYSVGAGESVRLIMASAGGATVTANYSITDGAALAELNADTLHALAGGTVTVTAAPVVTSGAFAGHTLSAATVKVYIRELTLKAGKTLSVVSGGNVTLSASDFEFRGLRDGVTANTSLSVSETSDLISVSGMIVNAANGANAYIAGGIIPADKIVKITVTGRDSGGATYVGEFDMAVKPSPVTVIKTLSLNGSNLSDEAVPALLKGDALVATLTVKNVILSDADVRFEFDGTGNNVSVTRSVSGADTVFTLNYTAAVGDTSLALFARIYGTEYKLFETALDVADIPEVFLDASGANDTVAADGGVYNEYTVSASGGMFNKIVLDDLNGATVSASGASVIGNTLNIPGGSATLTFRVSATAAGNITFTPKVTVITGAGGEKEITLDAVSFTAVTVGSLDITANCGGDDRATFALVDAVELSASLTSGLNVTPSFSLAHSTAGASLSGNVLRASAAGTYTVIATATAAGKTVTANIEITFVADPVITEFKYDASGNMTLTADNMPSGIKREFAVVYGAAYGSVNKTTGEITKVQGRVDGSFTVRVTYTVTDTASPLYNRTYTKETSVFVAKEIRPEFKATVSASDVHAVTLSEGFKDIVALVTGDCARVTVRGNIASAQWLAPGSVRIDFFGTLDNGASNYNGELFTCHIELENTEEVPVESKFAPSLDVSNAGISLPADADGAKITGVEIAYRAANAVSIAEDGKSAVINWKALGGRETRFTVTVQVESVHYGLKIFAYEVVLPGLEYSGGVLKVPAYMGDTVTVESATSGVTVTATETENGYAISASTETEALGGEQTVTLTVTVAGGISFTLEDVTVNVDYTAPEPEPEPTPAPSPTPGGDGSETETENTGD